MKKTYYIIGVSALALVLATTVTRAEEPRVVREQMRVDSSRIQNIKNNEEFRNNALKSREGKMASTSSTTRMMPRQNLEKRMASSSEKRGEMRDEAEMKDTKNKMEVRKEVFEKQKDHLIGQLSHSLENLKQVRTRIVSRIQKAESSGKNMTEAKNLLVIADAKLSVAQTAVNALLNLNASSTITTGTTTASTTATTSTMINLGKARQIGASAIQAINDARKALSNVVASISHSLGLKVENAGVTSTTTATTTL